jgi:phage baseplate assembly protein W
MSAAPDPVGWPFLPKPRGGVLAYPTLELSVKDAIRIILTTRPGEQLMRPRFGAGLQNYLDEGNSVALRRRIQGAILTNLQTFENRIGIELLAMRVLA